MLNSLRLPVKNTTEAAAEIFAEVLVKLANKIELTRTELEV